MSLIALLLSCAGSPQDSGSGSEPDPPASPSEACTDDVDNDGDKLIDCRDPDCRLQEICQEDCGGWQDKDGDGFFGCEDSECWNAPECQEDCFDGVDNDLDGAVDCTDLDCQSADCEEICGDGEDNDWDKLKDCADPDCLPSVDCPEVCGSGVDEDDDGLVDCEDADCVGRTPCLELCDSGEDEDLDGYLDCADEDCWGLTPCEAEKEVTLLQGSVDRLKANKFSGHPSFYTSYQSFQGVLTNLSGVVRYPMDPAQALSTATAFKSCSFQIDTWNTTARWSRVRDELQHAPLDVQGLAVDPSCPELTAERFLPDPWLTGPSAKGLSQGLAGNQIARKTDDGASFEAWFSGSALYDERFSSSHRTSSGSFSRQSHTWWYSGSVFGVAPFVWVPRDSRL